MESAKWSSWKQLETLSSVEAMRLFVKVVDDEQVGPSSPAQGVDKAPGNGRAAPKPNPKGNGARPVEMCQIQAKC